MVIQSKVKSIFKFGILNLILFYILFNIPVNSEILNNICLFKFITGKECWNCGMTRAFLSVIHLSFKDAYKFNHKVIIVFPLTIIVYLYSWYKYIYRKEINKDE